jgi:glycerophosphoryl diester phosphodiesterase
MLIIGHRGCSYKGYNQNTIRSYKKVIEEGAKAFEFDVQLTKDKKLVVVHNLNLTKVSNGTGLVSTKTLKEIKELNAGKIENGKDEIPTLEEVLDLVSSYPKEKRVVMHLELKGDNTGLISGNIIKKYIDEGFLQIDDFLISSFNWVELDLIRTICPQINIALLEGSIRRKQLLPLLNSNEEIFSKIFSYGEEDYMLPISDDFETSKKVVENEVKDENDLKILIEEIHNALNGKYYTQKLIQTALEKNAVSLNLWYKTVDKDFIEEVHKNGLKVFLFTVNEKADIDRLKILKPDGIFTDYYMQTKNYYLEKK